MTKTMHDIIHDLAIDAYLIYYNFYADSESQYTRNELLAEIALDECILRPIDSDPDTDYEYATAFFMHFKIDTCPIDLILTSSYDDALHAIKLDYALISTDTMPYNDLLIPTNESI